MSDLRQTPLLAEHQALGARMVPFSGWVMPLHYGSQIDEHHAVRRDSGLFDVSHMALVDLRGADARRWLQSLLANDVARIDEPGRALYSCMLDEDGGVIDDLIVYHLGQDHYRLVLNAGNREADLAWMAQQQAGHDVTWQVRDDLALLALQGPQALARLTTLWPELALPGRFRGVSHGERFIARTGYTGEDGSEIAVPAAQAAELWRALLALGVQPCGLGARDTLRLEAGLNLHGHDMDRSTTPLESGLGWTVAWQPETRDFIGRAALVAQREAGVARQRIGVRLQGRGVLREGQPLFVGEQAVGQLTSGGFAPTLGCAIGLARVERGVATQGLEVEIRGRRQAVDVVEIPFVRPTQGSASEQVKPSSKE